MEKLNPQSRGRETITVHEQLSFEERAQIQEQIAKDVVEVHRLADEKKATMASFASQIKQLNAAIKDNAMLSRLNSVQKTIQVDLIPNFTTGMMEYVDADGFCHRSRPLSADERQHSAEDVGGFSKASNY